MLNQSLQQKFLSFQTNDNLEETNLDEMPSMKLRIYQTCIPHRRRHQSGLSMWKLNELKYRKARLDSYVDRLPFLSPYANLDISSPIDSSSSSSDDDESDDGNGRGVGKRKPRLFYQFNFEYQQTSGASAMEAYLSRMTTKLKNTKRCPFCDQRCSDVYALLQHYRCCHGRWSFVIKVSNG